MSSKSTVTIGAFINRPPHGQTYECVISWDFPTARFMAQIRDRYTPTEIIYLGIGADVEHALFNLAQILEIATREQAE